MASPFNLFKTGPDAPPLEDKGEIDRRYRRLRTSTIAAITIGYASAYTPAGCLWRRSRRR